MVFTQSRGFVIGALFGLQIRSLRCRDLVCHAADTASLATRFLFGKLICVATLFDFGEKRCRKNLPLCGSSRSIFMTDQKTLDDIAGLLSRYPDVVSTLSNRSASDTKVRIRFRCENFTSLASITSCAVAANVVITVGEPNVTLSGESAGDPMVPFDLCIDDSDSNHAPPSTTQIFGVYLVRDLRHRKFIDDSTADQLQRGWNARPQ